MFIVGLFRKYANILYCVTASLLGPFVPGEFSEGLLAGDAAGNACSSFIFIIMTRNDRKRAALGFSAPFESSTMVPFAKSYLRNSSTLLSIHSPSELLVFLLHAGLQPEPVSRHCPHPRQPGGVGGGGDGAVFPHPAATSLLIFRHPRLALRPLSPSARLARKKGLTRLFVLPCKGRGTTREESESEEGAKRRREGTAKRKETCSRTCN